MSDKNIIPLNAYNGYAFAFGYMVAHARALQSLMNNPMYDDPADRLRYIESRITQMHSDMQQMNRELDPTNSGA